MDTFSLEHIGAGFSDPTAASQRIFRASLTVLSRPGTILEADSDATAPEGIGAAANAILLALLDQDVTLYVSPTHVAVASAYYRFHTGCSITSNLEDADFVLLASTDKLPALSAIKIGTEYAPELSATLVWEVSRLVGGGEATLTGPGIESSVRLTATPLDAAFLTARAEMISLFPRGVDLFLTCDNRVCGLPRTTRIGG
jgi:alpha-D-ribose 1-methylphosphonate 5-triphosphate synthase subunit PhnH